MVIGLGGGYYHDAAACIFKNDKLLFYIEEERLSGVRYAVDSLPML